MNFDLIISFVDPIVSQFVATHTSLQTPATDMLQILQKEFNLSLPENHFDNNTYTNLHTHISEHITAYLTQLITSQNNPIIIETILTRVYLNIIDQHWIEHIDAMQQLRDKVWLMGYAKQDPLVVYKKEAFEKFQALLHNVRLNTVVAILNTDFSQIQLKQQENNKATTNAEATLMGMLKSVAKEIKTPSGQTITTHRSADTQSVLKNKKTIFESEEWVEVFEVDEKESHSITQVVETQKKLRPNDKVSVRYKDGSLQYDVKYKKVKDDIKSGKCSIIG